jgi:hypothetical protein
MSAAAAPPLPEEEKTRFADIYAAIGPLEAEMEVYDFRLTQASTETERQALREQHAQACADLTRLHAEQQALSRLRVEQDLAALESYTPAQVALVSEGDIDAVALVCALAGVSSNKVTWWLAQHLVGAEALLATVSVLSREQRTFIVRGIDNLTPPEQIRALARIANVVDRGVLERACRRTIRAREHELDRAQRQVRLFANRVSPPTSRAGRSAAQNERVIQTCQRVLARNRHVLTLLTGEPVNISSLV